MNSVQSMNVKGYTAQRGCRERGDGTWFRWGLVTCPVGTPVQFGSAFRAPIPSKLHVVAHMRLLKARQRGLEQPVVIAWDTYDHVDPWQRGLTLGQVPVDRLVHSSRHSHVQHTLRELMRSGRWTWDGQTLRADDSVDTDTRLLLTCLQEAGRMVVVSWDGPVTAEKLAKLDPDKDIVGVGPLGQPSLVAARLQAPVVFNSAFFVLEEEDYFSEFSRLGDGYGLHIHGGETIALPLFRRTAVLVDEHGQAVMKSMGPQDFVLQWHQVQFDLGTFTLNAPGEFAMYTRRYGLDTVGYPLGCTPKRPGGVDFVVINRAMVGVKRGGGVVIPQNGLVISVPEGAVPENQILDRVLHYRLRSGEAYTEAMQAGPRLVKAGMAVAHDGLLQAEEFHRKDLTLEGNCGYGVLPTDFAMDVDGTRAARTALGWNKQGQWQVLAVESVNAGMEEAGESMGCTLAELAELALELGLVDAVNLDGGGSTSVQFFGGHLLRPADRRGLPGIMFERPVPLMGCLGADPQ